VVLVAAVRCRVPAKFDVLPSTATSLRPPAGGVVRCRAQARQRYPLTPVRHAPSAS
jgi:hypothetical protein